MKKIATIAMILVLTGCATTPHERRMAEAEEDGGGMSKAAKVGLALAAIGAIAYVASRNSGGGGYATPTDYDWAWDLQNAPSGGLQWVCRGKQTAQYAEQWHCASKPQNDYTWPGY